MKKILFVSEMFPPFSSGGAEWSMFYLAQDLIKHNYALTVWTPNFGDKALEKINGMKVIRFPFYQKINNKNLFPGNFFFTNPLWFVWTTLLLFWQIVNDKPDIIHTHGKYLIPQVVVVSKVFSIPAVATIRDFHIICNYGICLTNSEKGCFFTDFFRKDFPEYYRNYVLHKNIFSFMANLLFAIWGRMSSKFIKFFAIKIEVVVLSKTQRRIFIKNGFRKVKIVGNSITFPDKPRKKTQKDLKVFFAGRLTPGKGVLLLIDLLPGFFRKFPKYQFVFAGEGFLKKKLIDMSGKYPNIKVLGQVDHQSMQKLYLNSSITVMPSVWPEPFGRIVIESLSGQTPVVVTNKGALPELVKENRWGYISKPNSQDLLVKLVKAIKNKKKLMSFITNDFEIIKNRFGFNVAEKYMEIYNNLQKNR